MNVIERANATASLADYAAAIDKGAVIVTEGGQPIAALVPIENADLETASLSTNPRFLELIERSRARVRVEGGISAEEMRRKFGKASRSRRPK
jgi:antitoxin (DNA-binding transcriptional repressor) of toxin-antitoxin stability system